MLKKQLLFFLFIFFTIIVSSQKKKVHIVSLLPKGSIENTSFYPTQIIDNRFNKQNIGIAQKGLMNRQVPAKFENGFIPHLKKTFSVLLPKSIDKDSIIIQVNKLFISERTSAFSELGNCEVELEFIKKVDTTLYTLGKYSAVTEGKGADVTKKHRERILEAITICINKFSSSDWRNKNLISLHDSNELVKFDINANLNKGLYYNFNDLINNEPTDSIKYSIQRIHKSNRNEHYVIKHDESNKRVKKLFGFSDGEAIYLNGTRFTLNAKEYFVKSKMIGRYIYFEDNFASMEATAAFGLIGAMASATQKGIILDTKSGITTVLTHKNIETLLESKPKMLEEYKNSDRKIENVRELIKNLNEVE